MTRLGVPRRLTYLVLSVAVSASLAALSAIPASAGTVGGGGSGWVACATSPDGYDWQGSIYGVQTQLWWSVAAYAYDRYGNPYATYLRPYQGAILVHDPGLAMADACAPFSVSNEVYFDNGTQTTYITRSGWCYWGYGNYSPNDYDYVTLCNSNYYIGPRYNSTYGWGNVSWGITLWPDYGSGAISGRTGWAWL